MKLSDKTKCFFNSYFDELIREIPEEEIKKFENNIFRSWNSYYGSLHRLYINEYLYFEIMFNSHSIEITINKRVYILNKTFYKAKDLFSYLDIGEEIFNIMKSKLIEFLNLNNFRL